MTKDAMKPPMPQGAALPPVLGEIYQNLRLGGKDSTNPLVQELEMIAELLAHVPRDIPRKTLDHVAQLERSLDLPGDVQKMVVVTTGPGSQGQCNVCGRDLKK